VGGTSTVAISGTPAVTLSGTGTVAISGTPTVTVGGTATVAGAVTVSGTSAVNVIGTAVISGAVTVTGTATTARTWALSTASDSVVISGSATVNTITGFALETGGNLATLAAAVVANDSASEPVNVMVVAGETNDAVPLSAALPLGPTGRSVLVEAYGTLPLPSGAAKESGGNLDYLARSIEQNNQIIKLLTAILVSIGNNGGGFIQPEEATELVTLQ
jgi:fibronectin-binding autotransporter adhesin